MSTDTTQHRRFGTQALASALVLLMLLVVGCSEKETTAPKEDASALVPAPQIAETEAPPPVEAPEQIAEPDEPQAATEPNASRSHHI